jgi:hypothetical protein
MILSLRRSMFVAVVALVGVITVAEPPTTAPTTQPKGSGSGADWPTNMPDSESIEKQMLDQLDGGHTAGPTQTPGSDVPPTAGAVGVDPKVLGVAPGERVPRLRREGEFVINRRGRMVQATNGQHVLFVFEADSAAAPESPMVITPCLMLQNMEDIVRERGDKVVFILSGQVLVYRGVNYMLPTMMKLALDRGNIEN